MVEHPLCRRRVAGSNPAESIKLLGKKFYQEDEENLGDKHASWSGCDCGFKVVSNQASGCS